MSWQAKKKYKEPYLTPADRERIARIDQNPHIINRKCKSIMTLKKKGLKQEVCIYVYGKDQTMINEKIQEHLKFFQEKDKSWYLDSVKDLSSKDSSSNEQQLET